MNKLINTRQKKLLAVIYEHIESTGFAPTFVEMKESLGISSSQSILNNLKKLKEAGFIRRKEGAARSIIILPLGLKLLERPPLAPFIGTTSAGLPMEAIEQVGEWRAVSPDIFEPKDDVFLLKISGDSMINAGIDDGDVVMVKSHNDFVSGDIVLAQVGDEKTIKRFISQNKPPYLYLKPENPEHKRLLFTDETQLVGKVISVLKNNYWQKIK